MDIIHSAAVSEKTVEAALKGCIDYRFFSQQVSGVIYTIIKQKYRYIKISGEKNWKIYFSLWSWRILPESLSHHVWKKNQKI